MKRVLCILLFVSVLCGCMHSASGDVSICRGKSTLIDFYEEAGIVHIVCSITVNNNSSEEIIVSIYGYSEDDVSVGLLEDAYLSGVNLENNTDIFTLKPQQKNELIVDFIGIFAGNFQKTDRLVPDGIEINIVS